jgi:tetratricopeptide (TPR) repeat protein
MACRRWSVVGGIAVAVAARQVLRMRPLLLVLMLASPAVACGQAADGWPQHSRERPAPPVGAAPALHSPAPVPPGATVLFDGRSLSAWRSSDGVSPPRWELLGDGSMAVRPGSGGIESIATFGDIHLHVEWSAPRPPTATGQDRGNSGVFLMGRYEVQVLDSYEHGTYADGQAGAIYGQYPPRVNVTQPPGEWNAFDIEFRRPRFGADGTLLAPARMTVRHNGVVIHADRPLLGPTSHIVRAPYEAHADALPIALQDHGDRVRFRNIWVRDLPPVADAPPAADPRATDALLARAAAFSAGLQFRRAIDEYTRALEAGRDDEALLLRWRGHRWLSLREFDKAEADLALAAGYDPTNYGAWYHLGIIHFTNGRWGNAAEAFRAAMPLAPNPGEFSGSTDWLWMTLMRAGRTEDARALLADARAQVAARPELAPVGNAYDTRLALYRGEISTEQVVTAADTAATQRATLHFGRGHWFLVRGDTARARVEFERAVWSGGWAAFGAIVAEVELERMRRSR